jgi:hypothetical protein
MERLEKDEKIFGGKAKVEFLRHHCEQFLKYRANIRSIHLRSFQSLLTGILELFHHQKIRTFSRWDYDWFRMSNRMMDFYFLAASYPMPATVLLSVTGSIP